MSVNDNFHIKCKTLTLTLNISTPQTTMKTETRVGRAENYLQQLNSNGFTTQPIALGNCSNIMPEFGRFQDVQRLFGIKRGTLYNLAAEGLVKSVCLRRRGNVKGVRLFYLQSISDYLHKLMEEQNGELNTSDPGL